jgi:ABC-type antimicrobial peptide transport system permease subunit
MTTTKLILNSLRHHARLHLGALLGAAVGGAILIGALLVGDSVCESLKRMALLRLGNTQAVLLSNDRLFRAELADDLEKDLGRPTAPVLIFLGTASTDGGEARANQVQILGIDDRFHHKFAYPENSGRDVPVWADRGIGLNAQLAAHLGAKEGDEVLLRLPKPSLLSREAPMAPEEGSSVAIRVEVAWVMGDNDLGRFSLQASQIPVFNAFVPISLLQEKLETPGKANLMLIGGDDFADKKASTAFMAEAAVALKKHWTLADAELELIALPDRREKIIELRTGRVFLDRQVAEAARRIDDDRVLGDPQEILTYFINRIQVGRRATPFSMVTAIGAPIVPEEMPDNEIVINQWLADDLKAEPGDELKLSYFIVDAGRKTVERTNTFIIHAVLPFRGMIKDPYLMPDFPGMTDAKNCRDWDTGFEMNLDDIRTKDNDYWLENKGTPKAFVTLKAGQEMWANRFGNLTAVRYAAPASATNDIAASLMKQIEPEEIGLVFTDVRGRAIDAVNQGQDFGMLFISFSFFLIFAALALMSMLFQFGVEQRSSEIGTLLALGFTPKKVRRLMLAEGTLLASVGAAIGALGATGYARALLHGLATMWRDAVGTSDLHLHVVPATLVVGIVASILVAVFTIWLALRKQARQPARRLLEEGAATDSAEAKAGKCRAGTIGAVCVVFALAMLGFAFSRGDLNPGIFFGAGGLLLAAVLVFASAWLTKLDRLETVARPSIAGMGLRNAVRRRKRSLATIGILASGSFLVVAVGSFELDANRNAEERFSGTGGFALLGETAQALVHDLNTEKGLDAFALDRSDLEGVAFAQFRVRDGDEASCLNLNRAQKPRIVGVDPAALDSRGAFTFAKVIKGAPKENPWLALNQPTDDGSIPVIGDMASLMWAMGAKKVGDIIEYPDPDDQGRPIKFKVVGALANSIMQGSLIVAEDRFLEIFAKEEGYRMFLIDAPSENVSKVSKTLSRALEREGLELRLTTERLAQLNAVQNTYLTTFQILGGLGLLLGSVGLGVVVLRNVLERRGELAALLAVGFRRSDVRWLVISEHGALLLIGLLGGVVSALVAVLPALMSPGTEVPYGTLAITLLIVLVSGAVWTWAAASVALRGKILNALRNE